MSKRSGIEVLSGTGFRTESGDPTPIPIVRAVCRDRNGREVTVDMLPAFARRVGLDLIGAASSAVDEVAVRSWARKAGTDPDAVITWMTTGMQELLDSEGEP